MQTYLVELISDIDEQVSVYVEAYNESEAEAIGVTMLENGELDCAGQICAAELRYWLITNKSFAQCHQ